MTFTVPDRDLSSLEDRVQTALRTSDDTALTLLGHGEVTLVLELEARSGSFACKRLPVFPDRGRFLNYEQTLRTYLRRLREGGVRVAETELWHQPRPGGGIVGYCVQETLPRKRLCSNLLHSESEAWAADFFSRFLDQVEGAVSPTLGLDAQASNWVDIDGELLYIDVTSPLMRDAAGRELLDVRLFFASLPWLLRDIVRVATAKSIFDKFYSTRGVVLDFLGNLHKERLSHLIPGFLAQAEARLDVPLTEQEVADYYRADARSWAFIQRLRKVDRLGHRLLRRPYPFLLPPDVDR
ncbi:hypothetical protein JW613_19380 [Streptomyces smyrnaeus]|uniref:Uncharacterized protein n=1 Tax=Streptomyces smyrnaeus TaxID=1387713 RepID=A0ABS3XYI2_9ACTN|nr:DUF6206 family protein [Streptomyces smyrnaeus]MBO8200449.1 hypothetical protein [Streptomyces smyrnaeus]